MRAHRQIAVHQSIEELLHGPGCPFCRLLEDLQAVHLQRDSAREIRRLCSFHAWGVAAVQDGQRPAEVLLTLVNENEPMAEQRHDCDVCRKVIDEEDRRIRELVTLLGKPDVVRWLRTEPAFCIPHAVKLRHKVPPVLAARIDMIVRNDRDQLKDELAQLRNDSSPDRSG